jgi:hypothetical protein
VLVFERTQKILLADESVSEKKLAEFAGPRQFHASSRVRPRQHARHC